MTVADLRGLKRAPRSVPKSRMETMVITQDGVRKWQLPDFQRPLKLNHKVLELADLLKKPEKEGGLDSVLPGIITLGILRGGWYICDGQHRIEAFRLSELKEALVDVRVMEFESAEDMANEFWQLNDHLVRLTPDDKLRALEKSNEALKTLRSACRFLGYGNVRRGTAATAPVASVSMVLRMWYAASKDAANISGAGNVIDLAREMEVSDAKALADFLNACFQAWGNDPAYFRLWTSLNLTILAWMWRRMVTGHVGVKVTRMTKDLFIACLMALSADKAYLEFLFGRRGEADRSPCYSRIKKIFSHRMAGEGVRAYFPNAEWALGGGRHSPAPPPDL